MKRRTLLAISATWPGWARANTPARVRAAAAGDIAARLLIERGADVNAKDENKTRRFSMRAQRGGWRSCD